MFYSHSPPLPSPPNYAFPTTLTHARNERNQDEHRASDNNAIWPELEVGETSGSYDEGAEDHENLDMNFSMAEQKKGWKDKEKGKFTWERDLMSEDEAYMDTLGMR